MTNEDLQAENAQLRSALTKCVASLDQLLPHLGKVPADVGLLNEALLAARPAILDAPRCQCCGYLVTQSEHRGCLRSASLPPEVNAIFETCDGGAIGTTSAKVKRVEWQDDGSIMVVIDHWPQPAVGEEIMVNAARDVFTLPLQPSGLSSGPRFVVHVPGPDQQPTAAVEAMCKDAERYRWLRKNWQFSLHGKPVWLELDADTEGVDSTDKLDAAIDAAMQETSHDNQ